MRLFTQKLFDTVLDATEVFTPDDVNLTLGRAEKIEYEILVGAAQGTTPQVVVTRYKSNDNVNFDAGIQLTTIGPATGSTTKTFVVDAYTGDAPSAFVRIGIKMTGTGNLASYVRVFAVGRS